MTFAQNNQWESRREAEAMRGGAVSASVTCRQCVSGARVSLVFIKRQTHFYKGMIDIQVWFMLLTVFILKLMCGNKSQSLLRDRLVSFSLDHQIIIKLQILLFSTSDCSRSRCFCVLTHWLHAEITLIPACHYGD